MGARSRPYRFTLHVDRDGLERTLEHTLLLHPSEGPQAVCLRALGCGLLARTGLRVRDEVCRGRLPALGVDGEGRLALWVELGWPTRERLARARRKAERVVVVAAQPHPGPGRAPDVESIEIDAGLLRVAAELLERRNEWTLRTGNGRLVLEIGGRRLEGPLRDSTAVP